MIAVKALIQVHRRKGTLYPKESVCGQGGLVYGAGLPKFPYPSDWGKTESEKQFEWCNVCIVLLTEESGTDDRVIE